jgi:class 3 adenylate cyclase/HAMP domain-containing protein
VVGPTVSAFATDDTLGPRVLRPLVDGVARLRASVHTKLLSGFMLIALLLLLMGTLSIAVIERVDGQVDQLTELHAQTDQARRMIYDVTAQSHYRAMALADLADASWTPKIDAAKQRFDSNLAELEAGAIAAGPAFFAALAVSNEKFRVSSNEVTALFEAGEYDRALAQHIREEHLYSHELEDALNVLIADSEKLLTKETADFDSDRKFLTLAIASFSGASLLAALALGAILSWSLINPVRRVDAALGVIADGDFRRRVEVPNRDEFGRLTENLNRTTEHLATLYGDLENLNQNLQETVEQKVLELERASELKRYLSPQLAQSILAGETEVTLGSSRKYLTTFFSDIRGFTELSERMEPEELVGELNDYLTEMTEIVFAHGGTLDKYIGDAVMVFFGDPVAQDDHAERALRMAVAMQARMTELQMRWRDKYDEVFSIGVGIATGWVTVGNIGSSTRTDYTVLGNQVNLASRLADRAASGEILVTDRTLRESNTALAATLIDEVPLKGVNRPTKIYRLELPEIAAEDDAPEPT